MTKSWREPATTSLPRRLIPSAPASALLVQVRRGKAKVVDGPFAETKEHLGGFILINAASMEEAVDIATKIPLANIGSIEVRRW